jgi:hypothetical protein
LIRDAGLALPEKGAEQADYELKPKIPPRPFLADDPLLVKVIR